MCSPPFTFMRSSLWLIFLIPIAFLQTGCVQKVIIHRFSPDATVLSKTFERSYTTGELLKAERKQPIITFKAIVDKRYQTGWMKPSKDFELKGGLKTATGEAGTEYSIRGTTEVEGEFCYILDLPVGGVFGEWGLLVTRKGKVLNKALGNEVVMVYDFVVVPDDVVFSHITKDGIMPGSGLIGFDLVYDGADDQVVRMIYRERDGTKDPLPSFRKTLEFDRDEEIIHFLNLGIQIHKADKEHIECTIISDNMEEFFRRKRYVE